MGPDETREFQQQHLSHLQSDTKSLRSNVQKQRKESGKYKGMMEMYKKTLMNIK